MDVLQKKVLMPRYRVITLIFNWYIFTTDGIEFQKNIYLRLTLVLIV